jgi:ubiquinone/menaquinone biosynthesis C-methylase UbiE
MSRKDRVLSNPFGKKLNQKSYVDGFFDFLVEIFVGGRASRRVRIDEALFPNKALTQRVFSSPLGKKLSQKFFYPYLTRRLGTDEFLFLNWSYEEDPPMALPMAASDELNRFPIQLYHRTATQADLSGKEILEVGCGHGGGASYLTRSLHPASYTGLDLNPAAIAFCRERHNLPGLDFVHGNAEDLPFPDQSFDAVINVESSHLYPRFPRFLSEVARVLGPGGHFLYADFRLRHDIPEWEAALADAPMRLLSQRVINAQILGGMEKNAQQWLDMISRHMPAFLHGVGREFVGVQGSRGYRGGENGEISYRMYSFAKD